MTLTPRQMAAYLEFSGYLERMEDATRLVLGTYAAQGDHKSIQRMLKQLDGKNQSFS